MPTSSEILHEFEVLDSITPMGFAIGLHLRLSKPSYLFQSYSQDWISYYSENGLVMADPTVHWGFENDGTTRWSDLTSIDSADVLSKAADFGLKFGLAWSHSGGDSLSIGSFACNDREFDENESAKLVASANRLHVLTSGLEPISDPDLQELRDRGYSITQTIS